MRWSSAPLLFVLALGGAPLARGGAPPGLLPGFGVDGLVSTGYRFVDVDGSRDRYREDINLQEGPRLFDLVADGHAMDPARAPVDRFHLEVVTPGNEPVQQYRLSVADRERWDLRAAFTRSQYFYAVPQLWQQPVPGDVRTDDLHDWNFVRTAGTVDLTLRTPRLPTLLLGYQLVERDGRAVSTVLVPAGDTFLLQAPVDDVTHVARVGTELSLAGTDLLLQQEYRWVKREEPLNHVLDPRGLDPSEGVELDTLTRHQSEHLDIPATTLRAHRLLGERVEVDAGYYYSHAALSVDRTVVEEGRATVPALNPTSSARSNASASFDTHVADAGLLVGLTEHLRLLGDYRYNERSQTGSVTETSTSGPFAAHTSDQVRIHRVTTTLAYAPRGNLDLRAGLRWSLRDANFPAQQIAQSTGTLGAVASARWRPSALVDLAASYENTQIDDPIATPGRPTNVPPIPEREIVLTSRDRGTLGLTVHPRDWLAIRYQLIADHRTNDTFGGVADAFGNSVQLTLTPLRGMSLLVGYTRRDLSSRADILVAPLYTRQTSVQQGSEDVVQSAFDYDVSLFGQQWSCAGNLAYVHSSSELRPTLEINGPVRTRYDLDRIDGSLQLVWHNRILEPSIEVRRVDYAEPTLAQNDYRATIVTIKLTKRWSF